MNTASLKNEKLETFFKLKDSTGMTIFVDRRDTDRSLT